MNNNKSSNLLTLLDQCLLSQPVVNSRRVKDDIAYLFENYSYLLPKIHYIQKKSFLFLEGYIPFEYKNKNYFVNVSIHIPPSYPDKPPTIRIIPAPEKNIILSPDHPKINKDGYYILDLSYWDSNSNISTFIEMLRCEFGEKPPIRYYNKDLTKQNTQNTYPQYNNQNQYSIYNQQQQQQNKTGYQSNGGHYYHSNPQYSTSNPPYSGSSPQYSSSSNYQYNINNGPLYNSNGTHYSSNNISSNSSINSSSSSSGNIHKGITNPLLESKTKLAKIVEDNVKTILNGKNEIYVKLQKDNNQLQNENKALLSKINDNDNMIERTESEIKLLSSKIHDLDIWLSEHDKGNDNIDIDEITKLKDPRKDHLLSVIAEDITYDEILYYLDEALKKNIIDITEYLKVYKDTASKQFLCKALGKKIRNQIQNS